MWIHESLVCQEAQGEFKLRTEAPRLQKKLKY